MRIDLHCHSTVSDGLRTPAEVVRLAADAGVDVLALTDHDTTAGWDAARAALPEGMELVPGMELSCRYDGDSLHMLAYWFDPADADLNAELARVRDARVGRARAMVDRLRELGVEITYEQVSRYARGEAVGRPHIARAMVEAGVIAEEKDAFTAEWIAAGGRAHARRYALDPFRAVELVRAAGGVTVLAHPRAGRSGRVLPDGLIEELAAAGLAGVEVDHYLHDAAARARLRALAGRLGLVPTGSSDFHGRDGEIPARDTTAPEAFERLRAAARESR
ncbi:PHP domain-containing protein [Actinomadura kijaniata]|uniref:PHP domain-containing protein n=1 Tax=Actinomadura kijaniata TaxID=46161 RepID=UPI003F1A3134